MSNSAMYKMLLIIGVGSVYMVPDSKNDAIREIYKCTAYITNNNFELRVQGLQGEIRRILDLWKDVSSDARPPLKARLTARLCKLPDIFKLIIKHEIKQAEASLEADCQSESTSNIQKACAFLDTLTVCELSKKYHEKDEIGKEEFVDQMIRGHWENYVKMHGTDTRDKHYKNLRLVKEKLTTLAIAEQNANDAKSNRLSDIPKYGIVGASASAIACIVYHPLALLSATMKGLVTCAGGITTCLPKYTQNTHKISRENAALSNAKLVYKYAEEYLEETKKAVNDINNNYLQPHNVILRKGDKRINRKNDSGDSATM